MKEYQEKKERILYRNRTGKGIKPRHSDSQKDSKISISLRRLEPVIMTS
ncbi:hypothetical protein T11_7126 [Trichinella zimbabwensis]|uniref:Uncharacterized protein n=1 Tax=Trichinella zimbabwensis TaxID=268475 RepID=A0A0V1GNW5_9BILA|nr:hypothetical protein T11_7126 [Trichinella zimbabwensis]